MNVFFHDVGRDLAESACLSDFDAILAVFLKTFRLKGCDVIPVYLLVNAVTYPWC